MDKYVFDKTYLINLDERSDRLEDVLEECKRVNLSVTRFPAITGGCQGCICSHMEIWKQSVKQMVLILEDDVVFHKYFQQHVYEVFSFIIKNNIKWDILYFNNNNNTDLISQTKDLVVYIPKGQWCTHCYAINQDFYAKILPFEDEIRTAHNADTWLKYNIEKAGLNAFATHEHLAKQRSGYSDLCGRVCSGGPPGVPAFW
jgi:GR25 family glycosyltransferase involved in LPS biosynthesis